MCFLFLHGLMLFDLEFHLRSCAFSFLVVLRSLIFSAISVRVFFFPCVALVLSDLQFHLRSGASFLMFLLCSLIFSSIPVNFLRVSSCLLNLYLCPSYDVCASHQVLLCVCFGSVTRK